MRKHTTAFLDAVRRLFPHCVTEAKGKDGQIQPAIDFDLLRQELSDRLIDGPAERYQLNWPGKRQAILSASQPIRQSFFPQPKESLNFQTTQNLFIEGDNLDALKLLQETYLGRIKAIYIDPPYNTGKDFLYKDNWRISPKEWKRQTGLTANPDSGGRFHSNWLSMMYPRLKLARNLLANNGVIFISIDDNEQHNLRKLMDEIFGACNFVAQIAWKSRAGAQNDTDFSINHEYILCYAKERRETDRRLSERNAKRWFTARGFAMNPAPLPKDRFSNPDNDPRGPWKADGFHAPEPSKNLNYPIVNPNTGKEFYPPHRHWRMTRAKYEKNLADNRIVFGKDGKGWPMLKVFYEDVKEFGKVDNSWFETADNGSTAEGTQDCDKLLGAKKLFKFPKPVRLVEHLLRLSTKAEANDLVMDFFAGSCTTAHAVMKLNQEDGGNRRFIMVQLPEKYPENSEAFKAGFKTIADIGKERIRRAAKMLEDQTGFRVLKIGDSNFKDCSLPPEEYKLEDLEDMADNLLPNRKPLDLLLEAMWILGLDLHSPIQTKTIQNKQVFFVADNHAIACFEERLTEEFAKALVKYKPRRVVFLDGGFASDAVRINIEQLFQQLSPATHITIL